MSDPYVTHDAADRGERRPRPNAGSDADSLDARLRAVERTLSDADPDDRSDADARTQTNGDTDSLVARVEAVERRLDDLDAAVQALQGAVGSVEHVNDTVERRANAALAAAERPRRPGSPHPLSDVPDPEPERSADTDDGDGLLATLLGR